MADLNLLISFSAGFVSFFSPCILPLIPAFLASMGAVAYRDGKASGDPSARGHAVLVTLFFIAGFSAVFISLGFSAGLLGSLLLGYREFLYRLGGVIIIVFGLNQLGLLKFTFLERSWAPVSKGGGFTGLAAPLLLGAIFSLGWSPCVGPVLAGILFLSMGAGSPATGGIYLLAYSLGMAVPFLLLALFLDKLLGKMKQLHRFLPVFHTISGIFLLALGAMLVSGLFLRISMLLS